jgi:hypothetical protein
MATHEMGSPYKMEWVGQRTDGARPSGRPKCRKSSLTAWTGCCHATRSKTPFRASAERDHRPGRAAGPARGPGDRHRLGRRLDRAPRAPFGRVSAGENVRNGSTSKTVSTDLGRVQVRRRATARAALSPAGQERQTRLAGLDAKILGLYAGASSDGPRGGWFPLSSPLADQVRVDMACASLPGLDNRVDAGAREDRTRAVALLSACEGRRPPVVERPQHAAGATSQRDRLRRGNTRVDRQHEC